MRTAPTYLLRAMLIAVSAFCASCDLLGGAFDHEPKDLEKEMSASARALIEQAFDGIHGNARRDYHVHMLGMNEDINRTFVNEEWQSPWSGLTHFFQFEIYKSAAGITDEQQADAKYL
ncbi:MAG TPA: hypothetical protein PKM72_14220, partial [Nitrospirales bacterium]|nr:hypothetical protein [Nitrospirales bacterium]